jgi:hypothetical protein
MFCKNTGEKVYIALFQCYGFKMANKLRELLDEQSFSCPVEIYCASSETNPLTHNAPTQFGKSVSTTALHHDLAAWMSNTFGDRRDPDEGTCTQQPGMGPRLLLSLDATSTHRLESSTNLSAPKRQPIDNQPKASSVGHLTCHLWRQLSYLILCDHNKTECQIYGAGVIQQTATDTRRV